MRYQRRKPPRLRPETTWRRVSFDIMLKCDGRIKCDHPLIYDSLNTVGHDLTQPMYLNDFLARIGTLFSQINCQMILASAEWWVIDDGIQPHTFILGYHEEGED